VGHLSER
jgi:phytoene dehydrogenase-like protein